jgi:hypothetical protein
MAMRCVIKLCLQYFLLFPKTCYVKIYVKMKIKAFNVYFIIFSINTIEIQKNE